MNTQTAAVSLLEMQTRLKKVKEGMRVFVVDGDAWDLLSKERMALEAKIASWGTQGDVQYRIM